MTDFVLGRLKFVWKGEWQANTSYLTDDIIRYGGRSYVAVSNHSSSPGDGFYNDISNWDLVTAGTEWRGNWTANTWYKIDDVVKFGGSLYKVVTPHLSSANTSVSSQVWTDHEANVTIYVPGLEFEDSYNGATNYQVGDIVRYGGYQFICTEDTVGNIPTDTNYWAVLSTGFRHQGVYNNGTAYKPGDVVRYGASVYVAKVDTTGNIPSNGTYWDILSQGQRWLGYYSNVTAYVSGDIVQYGGYLYVANTETTNNAPTENAYWNLQQTGTKFHGNWNSSNIYQLGDVAVYAGSSYISIDSDNENNTPDASNTWSIIAQGASDQYTTQVGDMSYLDANGMVRLAVGTNGQVLTSNGTIPNWEYNGLSANVFYVAPEGVDSSGYGTTLNRPFASLKYATSTAPEGSTIFVKSGVYEEQLPITVKKNVAIVGDNQRTVIVTPKTGNSDYGSNTNAESTMFFLSDGSILNKMTFRGMYGWEANTVNDANLASTEPVGVFVRLNPDSPVIVKSPYVLECAAIAGEFGNAAAIGALVDGTVHGSGNKSMLFHGYTVIANNGVGYWIKDGGRAEIVSCFTYYCRFGYATTGGGVIRSLNGNNSYGKYGTYSSGYDAAEVALTGVVYGDQLEVSNIAGSFANGSYIQGSNSGANAVITSNQESANKLYIKYSTGTVFLNNEAITSSLGGTADVTSSGNVPGQQGFVVVGTGFNSEPQPGSSIQFSDDTTIAYVVQSVSGTYVDNTSTITMVLTQDKANISLDGVGLTLRRNYSQARLTGHDFLKIGTGNVYTTNYPGEPLIPSAQGNEVVEDFPGRVYYISTDQDGNFRVGEYFRIDQATGTATLNASAFNLAGLTSLRLGSIGAQLGETINEFSSDGTLSGNSNTAVPTEYAVKTYVDSLSASFTAAINADVSSAYNQANAAYNQANAITTTEQTYSAKQIFSGNTAGLGIGLVNASEKVTISATAATGTINLDVLTQSILYYTSSSSANWILNVRGSASQTLDSIMSNGDTITVTFMATTGATGHYMTALNIDGSSRTIKWQGGTAVSSGNTNSVETYTFSIHKTSSNTFTVLGARTKFA